MGTEPTSSEKIWVTGERVYLPSRHEWGTFIAYDDTWDGKSWVRFDSDPDGTAPHITTRLLRSSSDGD